jgi:LPXTG-motif cell wall-anchored protein
MDPTLGIALGAVVVIAGIGGFFLLRRKRVVEEPTYHFNCPQCRRRLKYRAHQAGKKGGCPLCKHNFTFPLVPKET